MFISRLLRVTRHIFFLSLISLFSLASPTFSQDLPELSKAVVAFDLRFDKIRQTETGKKALNNSKPLGPFTPRAFVDHAGKLNRVFGSANVPSDLSSFEEKRPPETFPFDFFLQLQFETEQATDEAFEDLASNMEGFQHQGKPYMRFGRMKNIVAQRVDKHKFEIGTETYIFQNSRRLFTEKLERTWNRAPKGAFRIVADLESRPDFFQQLEKLVGSSVEPEMKRTTQIVFEMLAKITDIAVGIDLAAENLVTATATGKTVEEATELQGLLTGFLALGKMSVPTAVGQLRKQGKEEFATKLEEISKGTGFTLEENMLSFKIPGPDGFDALLAKTMPEPYVLPVQMLETKYAMTPKDFSEYTADALLRDKLKAEIEAKAFPQHFSARGTLPEARIEVDPLAIPVLSFHEFNYEVKSVTGKNGDDLLRVVDESKQRFWDTQLRFPDFGDHVGSGNLKIPVKDGVDKEQLGKATIEFTVTSPERIVVFKLDEANHTQTKDNVVLRLQQIQGNTADLRCKGADKFEVLGYDESGRQLQGAGRVGNKTSLSASFYGTPTKLEVAALIGKVESKFSLEFDLNGGQKLTLPEEPSLDVRERITTRPYRFHANMTDEEVDALKVEWFAAKSKHQSNSLGIQFPRSQVHVFNRWEHYFFGKETDLVEYSNQMGASLNKARLGLLIHQHDGAEADGICAAFGKVKLFISQDIEQLRFKKVADGEAITLTSKAGEEFKVTIDRNQATYDQAFSENIIGYAVLNKAGKRLVRHGFRGKLSSWGQIDTVVLEVRSGAKEKLLTYDIPVAEYDKQKYEAFKKKLEMVSEISSILKPLQEKIDYNSAQYNSNLAGLHYVFGGRGGKAGKAMHFIPKEIANSDPEGVKRFGYELTPHKGYYFTFAKGTTKQGGEKQDAIDPEGKEIVYKWEGGEFKDRRMRSSYVIAVPVSPKDPVFFSWYGRVYHRVTKDGKLDYIPEPNKRESWSAVVNFIDD